MGKNIQRVQEMLDGNYKRKIQVGYNKTEQYLDGYTKKYYNDILSIEERHIEWFDSVVGLISWLENLGIGKFYSFTMNNNFSKTQ